MAAVMSAGPWEYETGDSVVSVKASGVRIASTDTKAYYERHDETDIANARLIAACPDLLAALVAMVQRTELYAGPDDIHAGNHDKALLATARAAIAKAGAAS